MTNERLVSRRDLLRGSAVVAVAGALTSATGSVEQSDPSRGSTTDRSSGYEVSMEPVGTVAFEDVPERWVAYSPGYADMGVALGVGGQLVAVGDRDRYRSEYYDELEGVDLGDQPAELDGGDAIDSERFRELDADVHLIDPNWLVQTPRFELDATAVDEIDEAVAPFFGNTIFRRDFDWHSYRYYTLYEAFEKVAAAFRREDRFRAFAAFHDEWLADVQAALPPAEERPDALLVRAEATGEFAPLRIADRGTSTKQWRDLGVGDALADVGEEELPTSERGTIGYETIGAIDPDVLLVRDHGEPSADAFAENFLGAMRDNENAGEIRAISEGRVFRGGPRYQGPIVNLFETERAARAVYPDVFGGGPLFDRDRVARLVAGEE